MRPLKLDYGSHHGLSKLFGFLLLCAVLILAGTMAWYFNQLRQQTMHIESMVDRLERRVSGRTAAAEVNPLPPVKLAEIMKFSNHAIHQLNLPWDVLFTQLEAAKSDGIALLGIEPNAKSDAIKVEGEAKDYAAMLKYVRSLSAQGVLQNVYLTAHKMDDQNPDKPVHFTLEASWVAK